MTTLRLGYLPTWKGVGLCVGRPDLMADVEQARAICQRCPVLAECRDWALSIPTHLGPAGVVAGTTFAERERILLGQLPHRQCATCQQFKPLYQFAISAHGRATRRRSCWGCPTTPMKGNE